MRPGTPHTTTGAVVVMMVCAVVGADTFYIAENGSDANNGSKGSPFATFDHAIAQVTAGDTIFVRGGDYFLDDTIFIDQVSGTPGNTIKLWAYEENGIMETPILDFEMGQNTGGNDRGILISEDYWHLKGLTIQNAGDNGVHVIGGFNTLDQLVSRWNQDSGIQLHTGAHNNLVLNTDSYENFDPQKNGEDADGFGAKFDVGPGNMLIGNRAWGNSDDGFDFWMANQAVIVQDSWSIGNGVDIWNVGFGYNGDGNGFKLGHGGGAHELTGVMAWGNVVHGIDVNGNETGVTVLNSTLYDNGDQNFYFDETDAVHTLRNNISFASTNPITIEEVDDDTFNTWNAGMPSASAADFLSLDPTIALGPRLPDGSLPLSDFLRLAPGSNLIDAGTDVGLPYNGAAPDLGAFETSSIFVPPGDADGDGDVDLDDYNIMSDNMYTNVAGGASDGDFDNDGDVDFEDFVIQALNFGDWPSAEESLNPIPEPAIALPLLGFFALCRRARRRS